MNFRKALPILVPSLCFSVPAFATKDDGPLIAVYKASSYSLNPAELQCEEMLTLPRISSFAFESKVPSRMSSDERAVLADQLMEAGSKYGEYLKLREQVSRYYRQKNWSEGKRFDKLAMALHSRFGQAWAPETVRQHASYVLFDEYGVIRGLAFHNVKNFFSFINAGGKELFEKNGWHMLELSNCRLEETDDLGEWKTLTHVDLSRTNLSDAALSRFIEKHKGVLALALKGNRIGNEGAEALAKHAKALTHLQIWDNAIHTAGAVALSKIPTLVHLEIQHDPIGRAGAEALLANSNLKALNFSQQDDLEVDKERRNQSLDASHSIFGMGER